ncbi:MAG: adenylate/guanylate cyclase domain-containing protein [Alphaproteobacteria bacterium]|nr:adenylate/guanylate cyclase domain-containing protein [Alphaproteobacteria bacterium]
MTDQPPLRPAGVGDAVDRLTIVEVVERPPELRPSLGSGVARNEVRWLLDDGRRHVSMAALVDELCWRLVAGGLPLARASVNVGTLHPQLIGFSARWTAADGRAEELTLAHGLRETAAYRNSPFFRIFEYGESVRCRLDGPEAALPYPIMRDLKAQGMTDYFAMPMLLGSVSRNAATFATDRQGGFTEDDLTRLRDLGPALSIVLELLGQRRISAALLDVYLGRKAGRRVLAGEIVRGSGEAIRAVIWCSDLRNFTRLSDQLPGSRVTELLNRVFETQVAAIHHAGGEVLKFVGDGLIAIFPIDDGERAADPCRRAFAAAEAALEANAALNLALAAEPDALRLPLAVALHVGEVFFGNIGGADRLDFTVIGPAVNAVSRLEKLAKVLDRDLVVTGEYATVSRRTGLLSLGVHPLRGFSEPIEVFAPPRARDVR